MTINPKVKIGTGIALTGAGAGLAYNGFWKQTVKSKKFGYGLTGLAFFAGGIFLSIKGIQENNALRKKETTGGVTKKDDKQPIKSPLKSGLVATKTGPVKKAGQIESIITSGQPHQQINFSGKQEQRPNDFANASPGNKVKIIGKMSANDVKKMEWAKQKRDENMLKIQDYLTKLKRMPKGLNGYKQGQWYRNQIALLQAQNQLL